MNIKLYISFVLTLFLYANTGLSQHDFGVKWSAYSTGDYITDYPFNGSFEILNIGETTIHAGDTIWYGYKINSVFYDISLVEGLVTGTVLEEDFAPDDVIIVPNSIVWPVEWGGGSEIAVCAVVFGATFESYQEGSYFAGDINHENNTDCLTAKIASYSSLQKNETINLIDQFQIYKSEKEIIIVNNNTITSNNKLIITLFNLNGQTVFSEEFTLSENKYSISTANLPVGIYFISLTAEGKTITEKITIL